MNIREVNRWIAKKRHNYLIQREKRDSAKEESLDKTVNQCQQVLLAFFLDRVYKKKGKR